MVQSSLLTSQDKMRSNGKLVKTVGKSHNSRLRLYLFTFGVPMAIFKKKNISNDNAAIVVKTLMPPIDIGLDTLPKPTKDLRMQISIALLFLMDEVVRMDDGDLLNLIQNIALSYDIKGAEATDDEWGENQFYLAATVSERRSKFTARRQPRLERDLSLVASTQLKVMEASPRYESLMDATMTAAKRYRERKGL